MDMYIGELAKRVGCRVVTIRYYEKEGLLPKPTRSVGNYRLYSEIHLECLVFIRHCRSLDICLDEIKALLALRDEHEEECGAVSMLLDRHVIHLEKQLAALMQLREQLMALRVRCTGTQSADTCGILRSLVNFNALGKIIT